MSGYIYGIQTRPLAYVSKVYHHTHVIHPLYQLGSKKTESRIAGFLAPIPTNSPETISQLNNSDPQPVVYAQKAKIHFQGPHVLEPQNDPRLALPLGLSYVCGTLNQGGDFAGIYHTIHLSNTLHRLRQILIHTHGVVCRSNPALLHFPKILFIHYGCVEGVNDYGSLMDFQRSPFFLVCQSFHGAPFRLSLSAQKPGFSEKTWFLSPTTDAIDQRNKIHHLHLALRLPANILQLRHALRAGGQHNLRAG